MRAIKSSIIKTYWTTHRGARPALLEWLERVESAKWTSRGDVRRVYPHADAVKVASGATVTIFNIKGNAYRLITAIHYNTGRIFIRDFMTHAQYDKDQWKERY